MLGDVFEQLDLRWGQPAHGHRDRFGEIESIKLAWGRSPLSAIAVTGGEPFAERDAFERVWQANLRERGRAVETPAFDPVAISQVLCDPTIEHSACKGAFAAASRIVEMTFDKQMQVHPLLNVWDVGPGMIAAALDKLVRFDPDSD